MKKYYIHKNSKKEPVYLTEIYQGIFDLKKRKKSYRKK